MIQLSHVDKQYDNGIMGIEDVSLRIEQGEFVYLIGPSGSGKSTFMKLLYREEKASSGTIQVGKYAVHKIKKRDIPMLRRYVGVVFQDFKLLPQLTVYENVAYALEVTGKSGKFIKQRVGQVLDLVGLRYKMNLLPQELSGGEQQRVAIARAIANEPNILIADEPTGNLDPETALEIFHVLEAINQSGTTVIMGTHNEQLVNQYKHRVIRLQDGRLVSDEHEGEYHDTL
ncbi:cell division ATP-binding protein FtsE [Vaginisenegalia massiliensis]|uniref:cell division ATP-binding protein FtsE n=1 Tax=Vaginisenegalia massiliensis TaxID=2058294 RepID=UPI000F539042|nr:cell division ATP-binding protein FtsE [Vaginisenegalia massiliensis]